MYVTTTEYSLGGYQNDYVTYVISIVMLLVIVFGAIIMFSVFLGPLRLT